MHLVMDGYGADPRRLQDEALVHQFLNDYPAAIAMTKIAEPFVYRYTTGATPEDWGVSGFVLIAESHISIHTFPERGYVNVDIFSCKPFDADAALRELTGRFGLQSVRSWVLDRGLEQFAAQPAPVTGASSRP